MSKFDQLTQEAKQDLKDFKSEQMALAEDRIEDVIMNVFATLPSVNIIEVEGFTPHFNDGDECLWDINVSVDWALGGYFGPLARECDKKMPVEKSKYLRYLSRIPQPNTNLSKELDYNDLDDAINYIRLFADQFELLDGEKNGTSWTFIRTGDNNRFKTHISYFDHE